MSRNPRDYYPTPLSAFNPFIPYLPKCLDYWEPACGDGRLVKVLKEKGYNADGNDLNNGYNFLEDKTKKNAIITNPPYSYAYEFAKHALELSDNVFLLCRLSFLGSKQRYWFYQNNPLTGLIVLSKRPSFTRTGTDNSEYAWFCWSKYVTGIRHII